MKDFKKIFFVLLVVFFRCGEDNIEHIIAPPVVIDTTYEIQGWIFQKSNVNKNLFSVFMLNEFTGYIAGASGTILSTTNAGDNWSLQASGTTNDILSINFTTAAGWIVGTSGVAKKTIDNGVNWQSVSGLGSKTLYCVYFYNENTGWVAGELGRIYRTTDGGSNWVAGEGLQMVTVFSLYFSDSLTGYASCYMSFIYKTTNGGVTWFQIKDMEAFTSLKTIYVNNSGSGFAAGDKFFETNDYGSNWSFVNISAGRVEKIVFPDVLTGYAVSFSSQLLKTTNSGSNWSVRNSGINKQFFDIYFVNSDTGWLVSQNGLIFKTTTGGE